MQCPTDTEVILQLHNYIFSHQGLEKGVEEHPLSDLVSANNTDCTTTLRGALHLLWEMTTFDASSLIEKTQHCPHRNILSLGLRPRVALTLIFHHSWFDNLAHTSVETGGHFHLGCKSRALRKSVLFKLEKPTAGSRQTFLCRAIVHSQQLAQTSLVSK